MDLNRLFDLSPQKLQAMPERLALPLGIDTHVHCRNDARTNMVLNACAGELEAIVDIANVPRVNSLEGYTSRLAWLRGKVPHSGPDVYTCPLICDTTAPELLLEAKRRQLIAGIKIFWEGVSNAYGQYITQTAAIRPLLQALPEGFVVTLHAECVKNFFTGEDLRIADREWWCIQNQVEPMVRWNKGLTYIVRHVSDYRTLEWIEYMWAQGYRIYAELSPQYLIQIDDDLFRDDEGHAVLNCDCIYWPRPKDDRSRKAQQGILLRCPPWLIYGSDFAMHLHDPTALEDVKINVQGKAVGGLTFLPAAAKSVMIDFLVANNRLEVLRKIMVDQPAEAYGLKLKGTEIEYVRKDWTVPEYTTGTDSTAKVEVRSINFLRGQTMHWQRAA